MFIGIIAALELIIIHAQIIDEGPWQISFETPELIVDFVNEGIDVFLYWEYGPELTQVVLAHYTLPSDKGYRTSIAGHPCKGKREQKGSFNSIVIYQIRIPKCTSGRLTLIIPKITKQLHGYIGMELQGVPINGTPTLQKGFLPLFIAATPRKVVCKVENEFCECKIYGVYGRFPIHFNAFDGTKHQCEKSDLYDDTEKDKLVQYCSIKMVYRKLNMMLTYYKEKTFEKVEMAYTCSESTPDVGSIRTTQIVIIAVVGGGTFLLLCGSLLFYMVKARRTRKSVSTEEHEKRVARIQKPQKHTHTKVRKKKKQKQHSPKKSKVVDVEY